MLVGASIYGRAWFAHADPFETYGNVIGRLSPWGRRPDGRLVLRKPLENLDALPPAPGLAATMAVLLGSTVYDSVQGTTWWIRSVQSSAVSPVLLQTVGLCACVLFVYVTFATATALSGVAGQTSGLRRWSLPDHYAHSVVPIVVGYVVAHYLTFLVIVGQPPVVRLSDPLAEGVERLRDR